MKLEGVEVYDDNNDSYQCNVELKLRDQVVTNQDVVTFSAQMTPTLNEVGSDLAPITPRYGGEVGNEGVTFRGANMSSGSNGSVHVFIDMVPCAVTKRTDAMV